MKDRDDLFALNRRNDQATGNESFFYRYLNARAAAWPVAFDPGLADRDDLSLSVVDRLCADSPPLCAARCRVSIRQRAARRHGSRYLDELTAFNYRFEAGDDYFGFCFPQRSMPAA